MKFFILILIFISLYCIEAKYLDFPDPNTQQWYRVTSHNFKKINASQTHRSIIQVSRLNSSRKEYENVQKLKFHPALVDFDLHCSPSYCYLVTVTGRSKLNIELYAWQRTQFDSVAKRDSFARPNAVKIFLINDEFYIAIAQEQLGLIRRKIPHASDEPTRFIGCPILKFTKGNEQNMRYHQFIKLPFHPKHVNHFISANEHFTSNNAEVKHTENFFLVFSRDNHGYGTGSRQTHSFAWSPLDTYFWPHRLPRGLEIKKSTKPATSGFILFHPPAPKKLNQTAPVLDNTEPTEACFHQLQRILSERDLRSRRLLESSRSIWRTKTSKQLNLTDISSQVIVRGDVIVRGSMIESPQISLLGARNLPQPPPVPVIATNVLSHYMKSLSPVTMNQKLHQASHSIKYIRDKLTRAVYSDIPHNHTSVFNSRVVLFGNIYAKEVILKGVGNSDVILNTIAFNQLERELINLTGSQVITPQVQFRGQVVADILEIHGLINDRYFLKDAIDRTSIQTQIIHIPNYVFPNETLEFGFIEVPEVRMVANATINDIRLNDFVTSDNKTQIIYGPKTFKRLSVDRFGLAHPGIYLNNYNLSRLSRNAVHLRHPKASQVLVGNGINFGRTVYANKLLINNLVNQHINISLIIQDSVKTIDSNPQHISASKNFLNGLKINRLRTQGAINGIQIDNVFNLNPDPPYLGYARPDQYLKGDLKILNNVKIFGNVEPSLINGISIKQRAIKRAPINQLSLPTLVRGHKYFQRPLRVLNNVTLLNGQQIKDLYRIANINVSYPLINGIDLREISSGLAKLMRKPSMIIIDNLDIDGSIDLLTNSTIDARARATFGNISYCPLDSIKSKLILADHDGHQTIDIPIRLDTLRAKSVQLNPGAFNGLNFPQDFVLRSSQLTQAVHGIKSFQHLMVEPSTVPRHTYFDQTSIRPIGLDFAAKVNDLDFFALQKFMLHESKHNSTGEQVFNIINVHGNVYAKRINGQSWPEDILLKSLGTISGPPQSPSVHNRIYSPLIFSNSSFLEVEGQLVLRGPIELRGRLNGINLTEFSRQSATYGDKDLLYSGKPLRNKLFIGGIVVHGETRSHGLIDGVNIDDMARKVITVGPRGKRMHVIGSKIFMSDTVAHGPLNMMYLNDVPINAYLDRIKFGQDRQTIHIFGKKTMTGSLRINSDLLVDGLINGVNYGEIRRNSISLTQTPPFNTTLIVEGDVFMDNLTLDENNGILDGVRMGDLVPKPNNATRLIINGPPLPPPQALTIVNPRGGAPKQPMQRPVSSTPPGVMVYRQPVSIQYEPVRLTGAQISGPTTRLPSDAYIEDQLRYLRSQIIPLNLISLKPYSDLIVGFIDASNQNLADCQLPLGGPSHSDHLTDDLRSYIVLDQIDFSYNPVTYHLSAVYSRDMANRNATSVQSSIGGRPHELLSMLPVANPNGAIFISDAHDQALFLLISQDHTIYNSRGPMCPVSALIHRGAYQLPVNTNQVQGNIHVYLFHVLQNSSSLRSAYFDLYQTVDLPEVDSFAKFNHHGSTYALAVSRATQRIYLMILRGFSGFQVVSHIEAPMLDRINIVFTSDERPAIVIHHLDGSHKLMESVII